MARNKYPEVTVEKILEVSYTLFIEKGYDTTTIQDIVDRLGGLTKGAIYHHFKSKEDIMNTLGKKMFFENNPFVQVKSRTDLNGLQKMREVIKLNSADINRELIGKQGVPLLENPRILVSNIEASRKIIAPLWKELIDEGNHDKSINTPYSKELGEVIQLLTGLWLTPSIYPATADEIMNKFRFIKEMLERMGLPLINDEILELIKKDLASL